MPPPVIEPMAGGAHSYYRRFPGFNFLDLDDTDAYRACENALKSRSTKNFIADFGGSRVDGGEAWCALNVGVAGIRTLLEERRRVALRTRWMYGFFFAAAAAAAAAGMAAGMGGMGGMDGTDG